jgi:hypothetical protein
MEEDISIIPKSEKDTSFIFPNFKNPIKYISLDKTCTINFGEHFHSNFLEQANRRGLLLNYVNEDISFEVCCMSSILNVNLDLKYFKVGF